MQAFQEDGVQLRAEIERLRLRVAELERSLGCPPSIERFTSPLSETLHRDGIVIIPEAVPTQSCDALRLRLDEILAELPDVWPYEDERIIRMEQGSAYAGLTTYEDFACCPKSVMIKRTKEDEGLLDLFNVDLLIPELASFRDDPDIRKIIEEAAGTTARLVVLNAYVNDGVCATRGWHYDAFYPQYKAFLYLTDVVTREDGPFAYVTGSHHPSVERFLNQRLARLQSDRDTNATIFDASRVVEALGPRGTLVISNQNGIHRGLLQAPGHRRILLALSWMRDR
jgi:hypothetical protein